MAFPRVLNLTLWLRASVVKGSLGLSALRAATQVENAELTWFARTLGGFALRLISHAAGVRSDRSGSGNG